jgi:hypothetical protein
VHLYSIILGLETYPVDEPQFNRLMWRLPEVAWSPSKEAFVIGNGQIHAWWDTDINPDGEGVGVAVLEFTILNKVDTLRIAIADDVLPIIHELLEEIPAHQIL